MNTNDDNLRFSIAAAVAKGKDVRKGNASNESAASNTLRVHEMHKKATDIISKIPEACERISSAGKAEVFVYEDGHHANFDVTTKREDISELTGYELSCWSIGGTLRDTHNVVFTDGVGAIIMRRLLSANLFHDFKIGAFYDSIKHKAFIYIRWG